MAGIEKICEFSHAYPGAKMYKYNLIQIMPKLFSCTLRITSARKLFWKEVVNTSTNEFENRYYVKNPELQGRVKGNYTSSPSTVLRKLKRMTGNRNLKADVGR